MFMSGESPFAASNAATITPNSIVNTSSIAAHIGFADAAESTANKHSVDGLTKRPAVKGVAVGAHANACCAKAGRHPNVGSLPRRRQVGKSGLPVDDLGKTRCCGPIRSRCISFEASHSTTQRRRCRWWSRRHVGFPNRSVSSCTNALLAAVRYAPLRSKTAAVRVGRGGSSGTGCRPSCTRAM